MHIQWQSQEKRKGKLRGMLLITDMWSGDVNDYVPKENWDKLIEDSECSNFDGFRVFVVWFLWINIV